jgi:hypothetical protein
MATFSSWSDVRADIKNKIATLAAGDPCTASYTIGDFSKTFRSIDELKKFYKLTYELESLDSIGSPQSCVSYGRYRRFR